MIPVIIVAVIIMGLAIYSAANSYDTGGWIFGGIFFVAIWLLAAFGLEDLIVRYHTDKDDRVLEQTIPIVAAADGSLESGRFFLFGGVWEEEPAYFYYKQDPATGGITQGHVLVERAVIYEDQEDGHGYIDKMDDNSYYGKWYVYFEGREPNYEIHVPKGSVVRQFNFDLEK